MYKNWKTILQLEFIAKKKKKLTDFIQFSQQDMSDMLFQHP